MCHLPCQFPKWIRHVLSCASSRYLKLHTAIWGPLTPPAHPTASSPPHQKTLRSFPRLPRLSKMHHHLPRCSSQKPEFTLRSFLFPHSAHPACKQILSTTPSKHTQMHQCLPSLLPSVAIHATVTAHVEHGNHLQQSSTHTAATRTCLKCKLDPTNPLLKIINDTLMCLE